MRDVVLILAFALGSALAVGWVFARRPAAAAMWAAESRERERQVEAGRRNLVAWVSHDLRTPWPGRAPWPRRLRTAWSRIPLADVVSDALATTGPIAQARHVNLVASDAGRPTVTASEPEPAASSPTSSSTPSGTRHRTARCASTPVPAGARSLRDHDDHTSGAAGGLGSDHRR